MEGINKTSQRSMQDLVSTFSPVSGAVSDYILIVKFNTYEPQKIRSHPGVRSDLFRRRLDKALITDFFGGVAQAEVTNNEYRDVQRSLSDPRDEEPSSSCPENDDVIPVQEHLSNSLLPKESDVDTTSFWNYLRAWGGLGLIGTLVAFVGTRT
jgi:GPI-anchor transamidase subunit K